MAAKIGRKPYLNSEVMIIVLGRLSGKRAGRVCWEWSDTVLDLESETAIRQPGCPA
ncbi:hypothetical protein CES85_3542 (plasmid) [Ochrobactrum quorumnocens]|uniref:Uncharacterized protein n=1 Tax=Ochrobactrum quorumnocens TaxID=271865 RepID=A0A248UMH8_9HYPH|nr:hypothetical protein CES85_3542 [[Ochrobactrum] quorumnocens]